MQRYNPKQPSCSAEGRGRRCRSAWTAAAAVLSLVLVWAPGRGASEPLNASPNSQAEAYAAQRAKTIVELQQFRRTDAIAIKGVGPGGGEATLINLNPTINAWYLLRLDRHDGGPVDAYHLENVDPQGQRIHLDGNDPMGLVIEGGKGRYTCDLWGPDSKRSLQEARGLQVAYAPICEGRIYLRNPVKGHRTSLEKVTDTLRDRVLGGEQIVSFVRDTFFKDAFREKAQSLKGSKPLIQAIPQSAANPAPGSAAIDPNYTGRIAVPANLGISIHQPSEGGLAFGSWYAAQDNPGIYVSLIQPNVISPEILASYKTSVNNLDSVEAASLVYLIAFDLHRFDLGFALGTDHPRVEWSDRVLDKMKDPTLPGPDGIGTIVPLISTGLVNPHNALRTVAAFTAGFKRTHGAFKYGDLALKNHGSHYGFIESGVVFSKLQPGLATLFVLDDNSIRMKTWTESDNAQLARIKYARQNGVPIIEFDADKQKSFPGPLVNRWGPGNWSGSADSKLRTLRAGIALQESQDRRFLIYAYFSSATPSAMARVFQAYGCRYAMLADMNALEHTYLAVYRTQDCNLCVQHLIQDMNVLDKASEGQYVPRFIGYSDNRDFFYLMRRDPQEARP
jgi:hypothetical protein